MSVVVVSRGESENVIVADSALSSHNLTTTNSSIKVFDVTPDVYVGFAGNPEMVTIFKVFTNKNTFPHAIGLTEETLSSYLFSFYAEAARRGFDISDSDPESLLRTNLSAGVITPYTIFSIEGYFIQEVPDYYAVGSGEDIAMTAMALGQSPVDAVRIACQLNPWCSEPIIERRVERRQADGDLT